MTSFMREEREKIDEARGVFCPDNKGGGERGISPTFFFNCRNASVDELETRVVQLSCKFVNR